MGVAIGISIGLANAFTWAAMVSAIMNVKIEPKVGGTLIFAFIFIVAIIGYLAVKVAAGWMKNSSIAQNVK